MQSKLYIIGEIERLMAPSLDGGQMERLHAVLSHCLLEESDFPFANKGSKGNEEMLEAFLDAKSVEGCSARSIKCYSVALRRFSSVVGKRFGEVTTDDVRSYLSDYQASGTVSNVTADNVRRIISSLFSWLEAEDHIYKSPMRRIKKIRSLQTVKPVISDESMESLRDGCKTMRDLALVDLLSSTGMRVGELVRLNRNDIDFEGRECVVRGKVIIRADSCRLLH